MTAVHKKNPTKQTNPKKLSSHPETEVQHQTK